MSTLERTTAPANRPAGKPAKPYALAARELRRETLFGAARGELEHRAWSEVTMADVAAAAGVSRQTLYKEFGSRDEFAQAFVLREADGFISTVEGALDAHLDDPQAALTAAFGLFLSAAAEDPLIRAVIGGSPEMLPFLTTQGQTLVHGATERLSIAITERWPAAGNDAQLLAECLVRLAISYAALPAGPTGMTAASVTTLLGPYIEQLTGP
ncbi:MAG TPA: TetR family transcriptional regulator [Solirubrobacteraceae bacterium]|jgi:AcrR family transcriptional regulator|nr:TetR family transcriptional regulator [Solirubrobacteraceae bacterium]